ncbi:hypothetical protein MBLNU230_g5954t1 [Neophaeotheca triangularis]
MRGTIGSALLQAPLLAVTALCSSVAQQTSSPGGVANLPLRIISWNIRYAASPPSTGEAPWSERYPLVLSDLQYQTRYLSRSSTAGMASSFLCLQEVLNEQLEDLLIGLNDLSDNSSNFSSPNDLPSGPIWSHIGVGRDDGDTEGEYSPILYPTNTFKLLHFEPVWLSPTPSEPSIGWDAANIRILTIGVFEHRATRRRILGCSTHFDHVGSEARVNSVGVILEAVNRVRHEWAAPGGNDPLDFFIAGDFNSPPSDGAYETMASSGKVVDSYDEVEEGSRYGHEVTYTSFQPDGDLGEEDASDGRIDFVWLSAHGRSNGSAGSHEGGWSVEGYAVLPNVFDAGVFSSDHRAVVADTIFQG